MANPIRCRGLSSERLTSTARPASESTTPARCDQPQNGSLTLQPAFMAPVPFQSGTVCAASGIPAAAWLLDAYLGLAAMRRVARSYPFERGAKHSGGGTLALCGVSGASPLLMERNSPCVHQR